MEHYTKIKEEIIEGYYIAKKTELNNYDTKNGCSKNKEYLQIQGCPCIVIKSDAKTTTLNCFASVDGRNFTVPNEYFKNNFEKIIPDSNGFLMPEAYPVKIHINEFDTRNEVKKLEKLIKQISTSKNVSKEIKCLLNDKVFQIIQSQGSSYITINEYNKFKNGKIELSKHKRFGYEIFNRNSRWCPPIYITYEEFLNSPSYPAPLGIRPKDFCLPSELIITMQELINQIANFDGIDDQSFNEMQKTLKFIEKKSCFCKYCGEKINILEYSSRYKSSINFIEICHRDPSDRFISKNMYWGHCDCNRKQGGYTENDRILDGFRLAYLNGCIDKETYDSVMKKSMIHL